MADNNGVIKDVRLTDKTAIDYDSYLNYLKGDPKKAKDLARFEEAHGENYNGTIYNAADWNKVIMSAGAGLKIAMNQNFIIYADFAKCFTPGLDAGLWIGIGINYQF